MCEQSEAGLVCVCRSTFICVDYRLRGTMQGTLDTFGVVEILQMLGRARRCGTLHIECPERLIDVHFVQGRIAETRDSTRVATDTVIGSQLLKRSLVNDAQLREALARQEAEPCPLGTLLVRAGHVDEADLRDVFSRQVAAQRTVAEIGAASGLEEITVISILGKLAEAGVLLVKAERQSRAEDDVELRAHRDSVWAEVSQLLDDIVDEPGGAPADTARPHDGPAELDRDRL